MTPDDSTTQLGLRWTQAVSSRLETWVGTDYARFLYDDIRRRERESVRLYYAGTLWRPCAGLEIGLDFEAEQNDTRRVATSRPAAGCATHRPTASAATRTRRPATTPSPGSDPAASRDRATTASIDPHAMSDDGPQRRPADRGASRAPVELDDVRRISYDA